MSGTKPLPEPLRTKNYSQDQAETSLYILIKKWFGMDICCLFICVMSEKKHWEEVTNFQHFLSIPKCNLKSSLQLMTNFQHLSSSPVKMTNSILSKLSHHQIDGLVQDSSDSIVNTLELLQSCTKASKCWINIDKKPKNSNQLKSFFDLFSKCPWLLSSNDMPFSWSWHSSHQHFFQGEICQTLKFCEIVISNNVLL